MIHPLYFKTQFFDLRTSNVISTLSMVSSDYIYHVLRQEILSLELLPGTQVREEELAERRYYLAFSRQAPAWARQRLRELAAEAEDHARRLMAVYYLIQGSCYHPTIPGGPIRPGKWCAALRERYHAAACNGLNYARVADETTDLCLSRLLKELSAEEYRHADQLLAMLERSLRG